jgi:DNA primase
MPGIDFAALRARITMEEVLDLLNFRPVQHMGSRVRGTCLFQCGGSPRDFVANLARRRYRCFHCKRNGNHLDLWAALHQQEFYDATHALCQQLNIDPPLKSRG